MTSEQAYKMVENEIKSDPRHDFVIDAVTEHEFGWVFHYVPRKYKETGNLKYLVPGSTPLVVTRDGKMESLCDSLTATDVGVSQYLKNWRAARPTR